MCVWWYSVSVSKKQKCFPKPILMATFSCNINTISTSPTTPTFSSSLFSVSTFSPNGLVSSIYLSVSNQNKTASINVFQKCFLQTNPFLYSYPRFTNLSISNKSPNFKIISSLIQECKSLKCLDKIYSVIQKN